MFLWRLVQLIGDGDRVENKDRDGGVGIQIEMEIEMVGWGYR